MSSHVDPGHRSHSRLRRALHRIGASSDELEAEHLQEETVEVGGTPIGACTVGDRVCVSGTLRTVTLRPQGGVPSLEAELYDGSARLRLVWLGRRTVGGVEPGRTIVARGRLTDQRGVLTLYNPSYELRQ
ncbi:MAG TPA: OB-fold nucleic acid binding domain-containing protein [Actinomycetes bacterium]|nr:OB-fold nucleic acid binding domain-containing protein [Actinomycetes bacterium]